MKISVEDTSSSRRDFIKVVGATVVGAGVVGRAGAQPTQLENKPPLTHLSAKKLAQMIASREVSAEEVAAAYLARIEAVNQKINAIFQVDPARVLAEARQADTDLKRGVNRGPLHGVPFSMKDQLLTKGIVTTNGCPELKNYVPAEDATVVKRLKDAGGILLGKSNVPEMCHHGITDNLVYGRTSNPYNLDHTPGGSSGGEAAIIAAGGAPFGIGTDMGGSIRGPSHACGTTGIKPTNRRVPETGMLGAFAPSVSHWNGVGPMARHVEDLGVVLDIISGPDGKDRRVPPVAAEMSSNKSVENLKVAYFLDDGFSTPTQEIQDAVKRATDSLRSHVSQVTENRPDVFAEGQDLWLYLMVPSWAVAARYWQHEYAHMAGTTVSPRRLFLSEFLLKWIDHLYGTGRFSPERHFELEIALERYTARMLAFMDNCDILVCPIANKPAGPHSAAQEFDAIALDEFWDFIKRDVGAFTMVFNVTGWPAVAVRGGTSLGGMPIGVQIVAKPWKEDQAIAVAALIEKQLGGWQPPPNL
jgi:amidase